MNAKAICRILCVMFVCIFLLSSLGGCKRNAESDTLKTDPTEEAIPETTEVVTSAPVTPSPAPSLTNKPAPVYTSVETDKKVVSLVFEGYTDTKTTNAILDKLSGHGVKATFFVSAVDASEHSEDIKNIHVHGHEIGNYGISGAKTMEADAVTYNVHQLEKTQEVLSNFCGVKAALTCMNGTAYTTEVLQAVNAAGLEAAVKPTYYANHRSFNSLKNAETYSSGIVRGSIISIKLGQELGDGEYENQGDPLDERPAIDPSPSIEEDGEERKGKWENVADVTDWLLTALEKSGYSVVGIRELQNEQVSLLGDAVSLSDTVRKTFDYAFYPIPVTDAPAGQNSVRTGDYADFNGVVFLGDASTASLRSYVEWRRETEPGFMGNAQFLSSANLSVEKALSDNYTILVNGEKLSISDALKVLDAKKVYVMLRYENALAYTRDNSISNLKLLVYYLKKKIPEIEVVIESALPMAAAYAGTPTNAQIFRYDLSAAEMCLKYGLKFVDIAYAMRDEKGNLKSDYILETSNTGAILSDAGCEAWINYLLKNIPQ